MPRQIKLHPLGLWHRPREGNGGNHVACMEEEILGPFLVRDGPLLLDLCPLCWSAMERDRGKLKKYMRELALRSDDERVMFDPDFEPTPRDEIVWIPNDHEKKRP